MCGFAREKKTTAKLSKFIHPLLRSYATLNVAQIDAEIEFIEQTECLVVAVVVIALTANNRQIFSRNACEIYSWNDIREISLRVAY